MEVATILAGTGLSSEPPRLASPITKSVSSPRPIHARLRLLLRVRSLQKRQRSRHDRSGDDAEARDDPIRRSCACSPSASTAPSRGCASSPKRSSVLVPVSDESGRAVGHASPGESGDPADDRIHGLRKSRSTPVSCRQRELSTLVLSETNAVLHGVAFGVRRPLLIDARALAATRRQRLTQKVSPSRDQAEYTGPRFDPGG